MANESLIVSASPGVFVTHDAIVRVGAEIIERIKVEARRVPRGRARLNAHPGPDAVVHEMLIALARETYLQPHRHIDKSESFHVIEGTADVVVFDDDGDITDVVPLGPPGGGRCFYYRQSQTRFHTLVIHSPLFVIHETTNGPFAPERTVFAEWAPAEGTAESRAYMEELRERVKRWMSART